MFKNVSGQKITVFAFDYSTGAPKTGDAANLTVYVSKDDGSVTVLGDTSATELDATNAKGSYTFDLTQAESNADKLVFTGKSGTSNVAIVPQTVYTAPASFTAFVTPTGATVGSVTGAVGSVTGAVGSVTGNVGGNVAGSVASVTAGVTLAASAIQAIWDALTSALTTAGSIGKLLVDNVNATISSRLASASYTAPLDAAGTRTALGLASANLDTQIGDVPTNAELATALGTADDAVLAAIAALNNLSSAGAQSAAAAALTAYTAATAAQVAAVQTGVLAKLPSALSSNGNIKADVKEINDAALTGDGTSGTPWGPA